VDETGRCRKVQEGMNLGKTQCLCGFAHFVNHPAPIGGKLPKLDVAGSIPVSRSIFSISPDHFSWFAGELSNFLTCDL
jgi:hypothetical protein